MAYDINTTLNDAFKRIDELEKELARERQYTKEMEIQLVNKQTLTTNIQKLEQILISRIDSEYRAKYEKDLNDKNIELEETYNIINSLKKEVNSYKNENTDLIKFIQTQLDNLIQEPIKPIKPIKPSAPALEYSYPTIPNAVPPSESYTQPPAYPGPPSDAHLDKYV